MLKSEAATSVKMITLGTKGSSALRPMSNHKAAVTKPAIILVMTRYKNDLFFMILQIK